MTNRAIRDLSTDAEKKLLIYRVALIISITWNVGVAVWILFAPLSLTQFLGQPDPHPLTWPRHWGAQLIAINVLYLPGLFNPITHRLPNVTGIVVRLSFAVFFFSQPVDGFVGMGLYDGGFGLVLLITYWMALRAHHKMAAR